MNEKAQKLEDFLDLLMYMAKVLIEAGCSSNRLESLAENLGKMQNIGVECFATPTSVIVTASWQGQKITRLSRIKSWSLNLDKIQKVNDLIIELSEKKLVVSEAFQALKNIDEQGLPFKDWLVTIAGGGAGAGIIYILQGSMNDIFVGVIFSSFLTGLRIFLSKGQLRKYLNDFLSTFITSVLILLWGKYVGHINNNLVLIGCIVLIMPGLIFLNAIHEIALKNLISGTSKLVEAFVSAMSISFGIASALKVVSILGG